MNHGLILIFFVSFFSFVQTSFREFGEVGLGMYIRVYKVFTKTGWGPWLRGDSSFGIANFLEEISSLSHSTVFLYFFALITDEGFLISPCYSLEL